MRWEIPLSLATFLVMGAVSADPLLLGGPHLSVRQLYVATTAACLILTLVNLRLLRHKKETGRAERLWASLRSEWMIIRTLPIGLLAAFAVVVLAAIAAFIANFMSVNVNGVVWAFAALVAVFAVYLAALAYALQRRGAARLAK